MPLRGNDQMTRDECIHKFKHQLWGLMLDVSRSGSRGAERSLLEDQAMRKIEAMIGAIYSDCQPKEVPSNNKTLVKGN